jgi:hypothetical protein
MQDDMTIAQDEIFGPVMALMKFKYVYIYMRAFPQATSFFFLSFQSD